MTDYSSADASDIPLVVGATDEIRSLWTCVGMRSGSAKMRVATLLR